MVPAEVCDSQDPVRLTLYGRDTDIKLVPPPARRALRNDFYVADTGFNVISSMRRVPEPHTLPSEVCNGQDPARSTLCGRDIDLTLPAPPGPDALRVTVFTLLTWYTIPVRQSGGCRSTTRYHTMCVMVKGFFSRRYADAIWI